MNSIFNTPDFEPKDWFPTEDDFKRISEAFADVKANGDDCTFISDPKVIVRQCNNYPKISKKLIVSIILHWDKLTKMLKEEWAKHCPIDDLKKLIQLFIADELDNYSDIIDKYNNKQTVEKHEEEIEDGIYVISAYDGNVRRHVRVGKKINGIYNVNVDSAEISSFNNLFLFKNLKACQNFIDSVKAGNAKTSRPVDRYTYTIKQKLYPQMEQDLTLYVKVKTTCGEAYICKLSEYCEE